MFKKMLSILLAFAMLLSMIPASYAEDLEIVDESINNEDIVMIDEPSEEPETEEEPRIEAQESESGDERITTPLTPGVEATAEFENGGETVYFSFTPETTAEYVFKSVDSNADPIGTLYDSNWNVLTSDFGSGGNRNFRIRCTLYAGETYYFGVNTMQSIIASVPVLLTVYFENNFSAWAEDSSVYVGYGDSAELAVLVDGNDLSGVSYQWSVLRVVMHGEGDDAWTSEEYVNIDGATDSSYVTEPVTERGVYRCIARDAYENSLDVYFTVNLDMHLTAEAVQSYVYVPLGETATLEVIATSDDPDKISYQWLEYREVTYGEGDNTWTSWDYVTIEGATDSSYTTGPITKKTEYYCRVSDGYGYSRDVWFSAVIDNHFSAQAVQQYVSAALGETATLEVTATSDNPDQITYEWRALQKHYNEDGGYWSEWVVIDGATDSSYVTEPVTERTEYYCYVYDGYGNVKSIWFNVGVETHFTAQAVQESVYVAPGETATLAVTASSDEPDKITYEWRVVQKHYYEDGGYWNEEIVIEGATDSSYVTEPITESTEYYCYISDGYGTTQSIRFNVRVDTHFTAEPVERELWVGLGETATLAVAASSDDPDKITYQWYRMERHYSADGYWSNEVLIEGATDSSYVTEPITEGTDFTCLVSDGYGNTERLWFYVYVETHFTAQGVQEVVYAALGETATLEVTASSDDPDRVTYQWFREEKHYNENGGYWTEWAVIEGATDSSYVTDPVTERGRYRCQVRDGYGNMRELWFYVFVETHLSAEAVQRNVSVNPNETATLEVIASSDDPDKITYQWYMPEMRYDENGNPEENWVPIEDATDSSYVTDPITEFARYMCQVNDGYGGYISIEFQVRIETNFAAYAANSDVAVPLNSQAELEVIASSDIPEMITYQWSREARHFNDDGGYWTEMIEIEGATGSTLTTDPITEFTTFLCTVSDGYGYTRDIWFNVRVDTHLKVRIESDIITVVPGETATMEVFATSDEPDKITYQWYIMESRENPDGSTWDEWVKIEGATESSYTTGPITNRQRFSCRIYDGYGGGWGYDFMVTIDYTPLIPTLAQPLALNTPTDAVIEGDCEFAFFYFIPEESDEYILSSFCENDTYVHLYNEDLQEIASDDDSAGNGNFYLQYHMEAGKTYYYGVRFYSRYDGTIPILLTRSNHLTAHPDGDGRPRVPYGETAVLSVIAEATDASMITYQWYRLDKVVHTNDDGYSWESNEWIPIEGETGSSYTTPPVTEYKEYRCVVEDGYGGYAQVWFSVGIDTHFRAWAEQTEIGVLPGGTAVLEVMAESDLPEQITYQWYSTYKYYYNDTDWGWSFSSQTIIDGATSSTFTTPEISEYQVFVCQVADGSGNYENIWFHVSVDTGLKVWSEQSSFQVAPDSELTLEAFATSAFPELITYQWYELDYNTGVYTKLEGETGSTFATGPLTSSRRLQCRVSDGYGAEVKLYYYITLQTHLTAYAAERILTVPMNGSVTLRVIANSDRPEKISYSWYDNNDNYLESETGPTLTVGPLTRESLFRCMVSDGYGSTIYVPFSIRIDTGLYAYAKETPIYVDPGEKAVLEVIAGADDPFTLTYSWIKYEKYVYAPGEWNWGIVTQLEDETGPSLTTEEINEQSRYACLVSDGCNDPVWIYFDVYVDSGFEVQLEDELQTVYVPYGQTAQLSVPVVSKYPDQISCLWLLCDLYSYDGENYTFMVRNQVEGAFETSLTTDPVTGPIGYLCVVDDGFGNTATIKFLVFVQTNLSARAEQESFYVSEGDSVMARIIASSDEPEKISYQWFEFFPDSYYGATGEYREPLVGATSAELQLTDIRDYHKLGCMVSDGYGGTVMVPVYVYVQNHFSAEAVNPENYIGINGRVELKVKVQGDDLTGLSYAWFRWSPMGYGGYYDYVKIEGADGSSLSVGAEYEKYCCIVTDRYGTPVQVSFEVWQGQEPAGYTITVDDHTKGKAETSLDLNAKYSGEVGFTVSASQAVLVAVKNGDAYTVLPCTTEGEIHSFLLNVTADTEIALVLKGDTNLDGTVDGKDGNMVSRYAVHKYSITNPLALLAVDVDGNGTINGKDGNMISRAAVHKYTISW